MASPDLQRALAGLMRTPGTGAVEAAIRSQIAVWTLFDRETARIASVAESLSPKKGDTGFSAEDAIAAVQAASRQYFGRGVAERPSLGEQREAVFRRQVETINRILQMTLEGDRAERARALDEAVDILGLREARKGPNVTVSAVWWSAGFIAPVAVAGAEFFSRQLSPDDAPLLAGLIVPDPNAFIGFHLDGCSVSGPDGMSAAESARLARYLIVAATWGLFVVPELLLIGMRICAERGGRIT